MAIMAVIIACTTGIACIQSKQESGRKDRQDNELAQKKWTAEVEKMAAKEAKRLAKEGWQVAPGALPLRKQLERAYHMQYDYKENLFPKYVMGEASSIGDNYDAAKTAALSLAITNLANQIQTEVTVLVENSVANHQLSQEDAASIYETLLASEDQISQSIGRVKPVVECYRVNSKNKSEVLIRVAYDGDLAKEAAKNAIREELEKKGDKLNEQLDQIICC